MKDYAKIILTVLLTLIVTAVFNLLVNTGSDLLSDTPRGEIISGDIPLPLDIPLSIITKRQANDLTELVSLFEKLKPESEYYNSYSLSSIKEFLRERILIAESRSEFILDRMRSSKTISYTILRISNTTDAVMSDISVFIPPSEIILSTGDSSPPNYKVEIDKSTVKIDSLPPGETISLYTTAMNSIFTENIRLLYRGKKISIAQIDVGNGPLRTLVEFSNSGFFYGLAVFIVFFSGIVALGTLIIAMVVQIVVGKTKKASTKGSDTAPPANPS